jgi:hypothetical protein
MCIDYTDLNKHCPKNPFGLPWIDQIIDSTTGSALLSFLDCYSGYHHCIKGRRPEQDIFHHSVRRLLLLNHVLWTQECWRHLSKSYSNMSRWTNWRQCGSLCQWRSSKDKKPRHANWRLEANFWKSKHYTTAQIQRRSVGRYKPFQHLTVGRYKLITTHIW